MSQRDLGKDRFSNSDRDGKRDRRRIGGQGAGGGRTEKGKRYQRGAKGGQNEDSQQKRPIILAKPDRDRSQEFPTLQQAVAASTAAISHNSQSSLSQSYREEEKLHVEARKTDSPKIIDEPQAVLSPSNTSASGYEDNSLHNVGSHNQQQQGSAMTLPEKSCKLIDEMHQLSESFSNFLTENSDFLVVGVIGPQGSGKSTLLNSLISDSGSFCGDEVFKVQTFEKQMQSEHCTNGINAWVSSNRTIFLDCQPINSASVLDRSIQLEKRYSSEFNYAENTLEIHSLQLTGLLMNVCHVVLFVQDWFFDPSMTQFLLTAEMLKPSSPACTEDDANAISEYSPHLMFIHNKAQLDDITASKINAMQDIYAKMFERTQLKVSTGLGISNGILAPHLTAQSVENSKLNLVVIPDCESDKDDSGFASDIRYEDVVKKLNALLSTIPRQPLTTTPKMSEKQWLGLVMKSWEHIKTSSFYMEYNRLL